MNTLLDSLSNPTTTFDLTMSSGYSKNSSYLNKCYFNQYTKQVTLVYFINGTFDSTWRQIATIPSGYRPAGTIYSESTYGAGRSLLTIEADGKVMAWCGDGASQIRGNITYYNF